MPDPTEVKLHADSAVAMQKAFLSAPNRYCRMPADNADMRDQRTMSALQEGLRWNALGRDDRPVMLPCRINDEELTTWYVCVASDAMARALWAEMEAFIGPSYADFGAAGGNFTLSDSHALPIIKGFGWRWVRFRAFRQSHEEKIMQQWETYWALQGRRPLEAAYVPKSFNQLRAAFDRALTARDEQTARAVLTSLRDRHGLTAENRIFLDIRLAAAFERWSEIAQHRLLPSLLNSQLPVETYGDILEALYETHVRPYERSPTVEVLLEEFSSTVCAQAGSLFRTKRTSRRPAVLKAFLLYEMSQANPNLGICKRLLDSLPAGAFGALDTAISQRTRELGSVIAFDDAMAAMEAEQFDRAFDLLSRLPNELEVLRALLRCAREIEDAFKAQAVMERILGVQDDLRQAVQKASPRTWLRVQELAAACVTKPDSLFGMLKWQLDRGELVAAYVERWREMARSTDPMKLLAEPGLPEAAAEYLTDLAIGHPNVFEQVYPLWHELVVERAGPLSGLIPISEALLETLRARDVFGDPELTLLRDTLLCLVRSGADASVYRHALEEVRAVFDQVRSPHATAWALDVCDGLLIAPARDPGARLNFVSSVLQAAVEFYARLGPFERELLQMLAVEVGIVLQLPKTERPIASADESTGPEASIGLYSLDTEASRRASVLLTKLYPALQVDCNADEVCTTKLKALAHGSDVFVFAWKSSKHAAYHCVKAAVKDERSLVMAAGAGTSSLVKAASHALGSLAMPVE